MPSRKLNKAQIAAIFEEIATLLELKGDNPFRIRAYRNGARALLTSEKDLQKLIDEDKLTEIEGIGKDLAEKITTLATKGRLPFYEKLKKSVPSGLLDLMQIQGLGGKKIKTLYEKLHITSVAGLKKASQKKALSKLPGFGRKSEQNILDAIKHRQAYKKRRTWWEAMEIAEPILKGLSQLKEVKKVEIAGSVRRKLETVGDLDFLVSASHPAPIVHWFTSQPWVAKVLNKGQTKCTIKLKGGMQADLRIVSPAQFGFALVYFTGSKEHNIKLRERAVKRGLKLSEYGLEKVDPHRKGTLPSTGVVTEEKVYKALGLPYIAPELRENQGEFKAAESHTLPLLVEEGELRGAFHNHTTASDGRSTLKEMVAAAEALGWEYIGISDHSQSSFQAHGLKAEQLLKQCAEIHLLNTSKQFKTYIFSGVECDILPNGSLDFPHEVLKKLDYVVVSVHSALRQDEKTMTKRLIRAIENPDSTMVGHVTCRLLLEREPTRVNLTKVIDACIANHKIMELNANPLRLDMDWRFWHAAADKGLMCCINPDAHHVDHLQFVRCGVHIARKGWLEKKDILNTLPLKQVQRVLQRMKSYCRLI